MQQPEIIPVVLPEKLPWKLDVAFCRHLCGYTKSVTSARALQMIFLDHLNEEHSDSRHIYTDGSKTADATGCAAVSLLNITRCRLNPKCSIFTAELYAIKAAINLIDTDNQSRHHTIISDSRSVLQIIENPTVSHPIVSAIQSQIIQCQERGKHISLCWLPSRVDVSGNERADKEAKSAATDDYLISISST